jgi:hypothetical protein
MASAGELQRWLGAPDFHFGSQQETIGCAGVAAVVHIAIGGLEVEPTEKEDMGVEWAEKNSLEVVRIEEESMVGVEPVEESLFGVVLIEEN